MQGGKRFITFLLVAVLALGFGFGGGLIAAGYGQAEGRAVHNTVEPGNTNTAVNTNTNTADNKTENTQLVINPPDTASLGEAISEKVMPSVVGIDTVYESSYRSGYGYFFPWGESKMEAEAQGTGFIVDEAGYILTNSHVVNDGDYIKVSVLLYDGREVEGTVLWNDPTLDLAIIKIDADGLKAAELGNSDDVKVGSYAAALGNPLGLQFKFSMSQGIISGLDRTIEVSSDSSSSSTTMEGLIQTDATINSGNSGGPLLNSKGQVVGINSARAAQGEAMGFAIPINIAKPIVQQIKETGKFTRAYLGISGVGLEESGSYNASSFKDRYGTERGIYVASVAEGGGAEAAGLKKGDIIIKVNDTVVGTMNKLNSILVGFRDGESVTVTYLRDGQTSTVEVKLSAM